MHFIPPVSVALGAIGGESPSHGHKHFATPPSSVMSNLRGERIKKLFHLPEVLFHVSVLLRILFKVLLSLVT